MVALRSARAAGPDGTAWVYLEGILSGCFGNAGIVSAPTRGVPPGSAPGVVAWWPCLY